MTCPTCGDRMDATARCAGSDTCSACAFTAGDMMDGADPTAKDRAA